MRRNTRIFRLSLGISVFLCFFMLTPINSYSQFIETPARDNRVHVDDVINEPITFIPRAAYTAYLSSFSHLPLPQDSINVDIFNPSSSYNKSLIEVEGTPSIRIDEEGYAEWTVNVSQEGLYNIHVEYYPIASRGVDVEFCTYINGVMPFAGADAIMLTRVWTDLGDVRRDNRGNEIRPMQVEAPRWESTYLKDSMGYITAPYAFYFEKGVNTIRFRPINEPIVIRALTLENKRQLPTYAEMMAMLDRTVYRDAPSGFINVVEAETAPFRSSPTLYATYDRSSPGTTPYSTNNTILNMMGGIQWRIPGQWIEWEIEVPEDGLYNITFKSRQNYNRDNVSVRRFTVNGEPPFAEVEEISFGFVRDWEMNTLTDPNGEPYLFPLNKGINTIRMEVTLGGMGAFLDENLQVVNRLTAAFRKILVLVGTTPDPNRDYQVDKVYPEVMQYFRDEILVLHDFVGRVTEYSGQKGSHIAAASTVAKRMERFVAKPEVIPRSINGFKIDIGSLAAFNINMGEGPLDIDSIIVSAPDATLPRIRSGFFARMIHEIRSFFATFFIDYDSIGDVHDADAKPLEVWMLSGRDQAQALKAIVDDSFTPQYGISVNIRIVAPNVLLPAVVAGTGPDIALQVPNSEPVNYAMRSSAIDLSTFPGFDELTSEFFESSFVPFMFDGGIYALPETQGFHVLFYRKDIMSELGLSVPRTWVDIVKMLPILQKNNLNFGFGNDNLMEMYGNFLNVLYQRDGMVYSECHSYTTLDNAIAIDAFDFMTSMYSHYKLDKIFVFADRFRTGEMPIGLAEFTLFNQLAVSAPEIKGLWDFAILPGHIDEYGYINHSSSAGGLCSMMLPTVKNQDDAWTFMKWWVSADIQTRFGREMESLIGAAARYNTANVLAFERLAWPSAQRDIIREQWEWVIGTPEVPGGYYTSRHMLNAIRKVMNDNDEPRETLLDYTRVINDEMHKKRLEFGLESRRP